LEVQKETSPKERETGPRKLTEEGKKGGEEETPEKKSGQGKPASPEGKH